MLESGQGKKVVKDDFQGSDFGIWINMVALTKPGKVEKGTDFVKISVFDMLSEPGSKDCSGLGYICENF